jgi:predicted lipid-binding transport protein (Tim44 family)
MYCSSCGKAVPPGLSYCNYCGEKLNRAKGDSIVKSPQVRPETLVAAMVFTFVFGLGAITVLMGVMKAILHFEGGLILFFAMLSFLIMLSLEGVIIRLLFRRQRGAEEADSAAPAKGQTTRELDAAQARALPEPAPSVTEHTTRAFDPIYSERTSK